MKTYLIMKDGKYTQDYGEGKLTSHFNKAEKFSNKKAATIQAQAYGKINGKGYKVVEI